MREAVPLVAVLAIASLAPAAGAHAAPNPLDNAVHVLEDEPEDAFYWYDGYDLFNLFAREAHLEAANETGVVFRFTLYGGFAPAGTADELSIGLSATSAQGPANLSIATADDHNWTGDMRIVAANVTEEDPPWTGVTARMQAFASYEQLGVAPGGSLEDVSMVSRAGGETRDLAPGGVYLPHSQGQAEVPTESQRLVDGLDLHGPSGYVDTSAQVANGTLTVEVENALANGQHVRLGVAEAPGWNATVDGSGQTSLPANETATFRVLAEPTPSALEPLAVEVTTDLGGHQTLFVGVNGTAMETATNPNAVEVDPAQPEPNESPGWTAAAALAALVGLARARGRR